MWGGKQTRNQPAAPWDRQPVTAGAGSGHLEASLYLPCCVFWLGFTAAPLRCVPASASLSLDLQHTALANLGI